MPVFLRQRRPASVATSTSTGLCWSARWVGIPTRSSRWPRLRIDRHMTPLVNQEELNDLVALARALPAPQLDAVCLQLQRTLPGGPIPLSAAEGVINPALRDSVR